MESEDTTVLEYFFKGDRKFAVPIYQRNYEWDTDKCELLFTDAINNISVNPNNITKHFLGFFILVPEEKQKESENDENKTEIIGTENISYDNNESEIEKKESTKDPKDLYIIDGQQRLETIYLLLKALYDLCTDDDPKNEIKGYLYNNLDSSSSPASSNLKLDPKDIAKAAEKDAFSAILISPHGEFKFDKNVNTKDLIKRSKTNAYVNYRYFVSRIKKYSKDCNIKNINVAIKNLFLSLCNFICSKITLDEKTDDAQLVYDRINSAGQPLSLADKIRNYLLMGKDSDSGYERYWKEMENQLLDANPIFKNDIVSKYLEYYVMFREPSRLLRNGDLYYAFKIITDEVFHGDRDRVLADIYHYSTYYIFFVKKIGSNSTEDLGIFTHKMKHQVDSFSRLNILTVYPVLFALFEDFDKGYINKKNLEDSMEFLLNYLVRRTIYKLPSNRLSDIFKGMCDNITSKSENDKPRGKKYLDELVYTYIATVCASHENIFDDAKTKTILLDLNMYKFKGGGLCRFILYQLEFNKNPKEITSEDKITIEHIMPQNPSDSGKSKNLTAWKNEIGEKDYDRVHNEWLDKLGNLSLTSYNSEMQDKSFDEKKKSVYNISSFTYLYSYVREQTHWNETQIITRNQILTDEFMEWLKKLPKNFSSLCDTASATTLKLSEINSFTHRKPISYEINKKTIILDKPTKACLIESVCSYLYNLPIYHDAIVEMARNNEPLDQTSHVPFLVKGSNKIGDNSKLHRINKDDRGVDPIFIDTHQDNNEAVTFLKRLFNDHRFKISEDNLIINFE